MELYIEKLFLDHFYKKIKPTKGSPELNFNGEINRKIYKVFTEYGSKEVYINYEIGKNLDNKFSGDNPIIESISANLKYPKPVSSIKKHLFTNSKFKQTIVFTHKKEDWFEEIENKGALCFCSYDYEIKIENIIEKLHFKIDLSDSKSDEKIHDWEFLNSFQTINYNEIIITDKYILGDKSNQKMEKNIIPLLEKITPTTIQNFSLTFYTIDPTKNSAEKIKKILKKRLRTFQKKNPNSKNDLKIINNNLNHKIKNNRFNMHDRNIITNFSILDSGKGFNLFPNTISNSQLISETIFEIFTYNRINNILRKQQDYIKELKVKYKKELIIYENPNVK